MEHFGCVIVDLLCHRTLVMSSNNGYVIINWFSLMNSGNVALNREKRYSQPCFSSRFFYLN